MIRVILPAHLRTLARLSAPDVELDIEGNVTIDAVLTALEAKHPMLAGTIRDHQTKQRRPYVRFFACGEDWSFAGVREKLPETIADGTEPFLVVGAVAGGRYPARMP